MGSLSGSHLKSYLIEMGFAPILVDQVLREKGEETPIDELVNLIIASEIAKCSEKNETTPTHINEGKSQKVTTEMVSETTDKTLRLLEMGFSSDAISSAISKFGADIPVSEIADSIFAAQIADSTSTKDKDSSTLHDMHCLPSENGWVSLDNFTSNGCVKRRSPETPRTETFGCSSTATPHNAMYSNKTPERKRSKHKHEDHSTTILVSSSPEAETGVPRTTCLSMPMKHEENHVLLDKLKATHQPTLHPCRRISEVLAKPPYFLYGNAVEFSQGTWGKLSQYLYAIDPEFANTQYFSALSRKEGYIHNLPTERRFHILPRPNMTIEDAFPATKKWWPSWDSRKQFSCITSDSRGVSEVCERMGQTLNGSRGMLSKEQKIEVLRHCKLLNLLWVGHNKLSPIEPDQVEQILGYPPNHTQVLQFDTVERLRLLKHSFQVDTLGYHLSALKWAFPQGVTVLSLNSGIGGAEVALHRLGIRLKGVVSVESSETNQKILRNWWQNSGQTGELVQIQDINKLRGNKLESLRKDFSGFDIVICNSPSICISGSSKMDLDGETSSEPDYPLFFEFVRVLQHVRSAAGRN